MEPSDRNRAAVVAGFQAAAVGAGSWMDALAGLAALTGSKSGQLIGLGSHAAVPFNWVTELSPEDVREFVEIGGGDPRINPRVRAGSAARPLQVLAEEDFADPNEPLQPVYAEFVRKLDIPWICLANLLRDGDLMVGLAVLRSEREGHVLPWQKQLFAEVAPHVQAAVRTQMSLQAQGASLVAGAMEALSMAVFVCDAHGRVRALSPRAEAIAADGRHLRVKGGVLTAVSDTDTRMIRTALNVAAYGPLGVRPPTVMVVRDLKGVDPLLIEVATLPGDRNAFGFGVAALLIVRDPRPADNRAAMIAKALFGLTQAEAAVVADLLNGLDAQSIAERSGVSVGTIRTHLRHIFDKAGVRTQVQLISAISGRL